MAAPTRSIGGRQQDEFSRCGWRRGCRRLDAAGDQLKALGSLYQKECLGVGGRWTWGWCLGCAPSHLKGKCGLEVGENMDILGGQWGRGRGASRGCSG
jgi:hypothetical protein